MVAGLKFLSKKSFNPQNQSNQKRVWERQQQREEEARKIKEREDQLQRERDDEELAKARGETVKINFMYKPPPGLETSNGKTASATTAQQPLHARQPGDDDAAAEFRRMLAAATSDNHGTNESLEQSTGSSSKAEGPSTYGLVLQGSSVDATAARIEQKDNLLVSELEKAVGKRHGGSSAVTYEEQIQRFPALASAPRTKGVTATSSVNFKPLGTQIRNVRCMKCGVWGHSRGDRECKLSGWDPFSGNSNATAAVTREENLVTKRQRSDDDSSRTSESSKRRSRHHRRKEARRRDYSSDDDSADSSRERRKRKKKHRKSHKKSKNQHGSDS